jgi:UDP:flavonoid glycosyltransferase YjiC (YdhE family)
MSATAEPDPGGRGGLRVLVVATPMPGHLLPLIPLARAMRDAGHEVVVGTTEDALRACPPDLTAVDVAPALRLMPLMVRFALAHPRLAWEANAGRDDPRALGLLWAPVNERMAGGVMDLADRLAPDLVLHEPFAAAAAEAATRRRVPSVVVEHSLFDAGEQVAALSAAYQKAVDPPAALITTSPRSLVAARPGLPMRYVPPGTGDRAADDLVRPGDRQRVVVSRSTVVQPGRDRLMSTVVAAAVETDLEVLLVRPDKWVSRRPLPPNVRTTDWVSFPAVLPAAAGIVHHGGAGTVLTALAAGTPQLVLRGPGDRRANAALVAARGAGLAVDLDEITPDTLRRLVGDPSFATAAREVAAEIAAMPAPAELVRPLAELAIGWTSARG